jgi:anaerobic magnesium-protoporphyrin IX monomethyl ester cyclase
MARIALISMYDRLTIGLAHLSSFLKANGHDPHTIYFKRYEVTKPGRIRNYRKEEHHTMVLSSGNDLVLSYARPPEQIEIALLQSLLQEIRPDLIGISFRTIANKPVYTITKALGQAPGVPIVWGGISPTIEPEKSIQLNEFICIGEGEHALNELANALDKGTEHSGIQNLWTRQNGEILRNRVRPPIQDLDELPFPDYLPDKKYFVDRAGIREGISIRDFNGLYETMTARGCPFSCSYCCNTQLRNIVSEHKTKYLRRRSPSNVIQELVAAKKLFRIKYINFQDDVFTFNRNWLREFAREYKKHVGIPFWCYHHPHYSDRESLRFIKECGVEHVTLGVQSGSDAMLKGIYDRNTSKEKILASTRLLDELEIKYDIDIITNNPFEGEGDCEETLALMLEMRRPVKLGGGLSKLTLYPGTKIAEEIGTRVLEGALHERVHLFYNLLYLLCQTRLPRRWIRGLQKSRFVRNHPSILKCFLVIPCLQVDLILFLKDLIPARILDLLRRTRRLRRGKHL